jgi:hypothetical protein
VRIWVGLPEMMHSRAPGLALSSRISAAAPGTAFLSAAFWKAVLTICRKVSNSVWR